MCHVSCFVMEEFTMSNKLKVDDVVLTLSKYIEVPYERRDISLYDGSISKKIDKKDRGTK